MKVDKEKKWRAEERYKMTEGRKEARTKTEEKKHKGKKVRKEALEDQTRRRMI